MRVQRIDPVFDEVKDPFALLALPIRDAAIAQPDHGSALVVLRRIERPDLAPGRGVERNGLEARRGDVHPAVHHDRVHVHGRALGGVSRVVLPRGSEPVDVRRVDLRQRHVLIGFGIAAVDRPVSIRGRAGRRLARNDDRHRREEGGQTEGGADGPQVHARVQPPAPDFVTIPFEPSPSSIRLEMP